MQLGFVTAILHDLPFDEVVAFASGEGFACIEPMCWPVGKAERKFAGVTHIDVATLGDREVASIQSTLEREKVFLTSLGYYPNVLSADTSHAGPALAHLKQVIAAAPRLGLDTVTTFIGAAYRFFVAPATAFQRRDSWLARMASQSRTSMSPSSTVANSGVPLPAAMRE